MQESNSDTYQCERNHPIRKQDLAKINNSDRLTSLRVGTMNVCSLIPKLNYPEFTDKIMEYDIFGVLETKTDRYDVISIDGYDYVQQPRKQKYFRKSGGIGVFIKETLSEHVHTIETDSDYVMWLNLDHKLYNTTSDIKIGFVYQPPENSRFYTTDEIESLEIEITSMCIENDIVYIFGDFNSHTADSDDFISIDASIMESLNINDEFLVDHFNKSENLEQFGLSKHRSSQDNTLNNSGHRLLELCKANNLFILNGRCGSDKGVGACTYRHISLIDYAIATYPGIPYITHFNIEDTDCIFSDGHSLISTVLQTYTRHKHKPNTILHKNNKPPKWKEDKKSLFVSNISQQEIDNICTQIETMRENITHITQHDINTITTKLSDTFSRSASSSFDHRNTGHSTNDKPWFGRECHRARKEYHRTKTAHHINPTHVNKQRLKTASNKYKRTMNKYVNMHKNRTKTKLRNLKLKQPREFWKLLNNLESNKMNGNISIDKFYEYFKNVNDAEQIVEENYSIDEFNIEYDDEILNTVITAEEIKKCALRLNNNKSPANDLIINEYIKSTLEIFLPFYTPLFNIVLDTGIIPESWLEGIICPIYKGKGDPSHPENYRPITLVSCLGKLFTSVLNARLTTYLDEQMLLKENQAGFRKGYATTDHAFVLNSLVEILKAQKGKLFCCFIDFSKAFDSVWRNGLWYKLLKHNINGKLFQVIYNMYQNIRSCVKHSGEQSESFYSNIGLRQGENLSPVLFALFLNDLEEYMELKSCQGITLQLSTPEFAFYMKILVLLYADDTAVIADNPVDFQTNLDHFYSYSQKWKLNVNYSKTKIVIFGARKTNKFNFTLGGNNIEIVDNYKYLGIFFSKTRTFFKARKHLVDQARKAMHLLYKRIRKLNLPVDLQLQIFDHTILPILLYGSELWGYENTDIIERIHTEFLRNITKLRKTTPLYMLYAELGRYPLEINIKYRMISYWISLKVGKQEKLSNLAYETLRYNLPNSKWIQNIIHILQSVGRNDLWLLDKEIEHPRSIKSSILRTLKDQYIQKWSSSLQLSSKGKTYSIFKESIQLEPFMIHIPKLHYITLIKFRTSNHKLPIETGRWNNVDLPDRKCTMCDMNTLADEYHYLLECPHFRNERKIYINKSFYLRPNIIKFKNLMQSKNNVVLIKISKFMKIIMDSFNN